MLYNRSDKEQRYSAVAIHCLDKLAESRCLLLVTGAETLTFEIQIWPLAFQENLALLGWLFWCSNCFIDLLKRELFTCNRRKTLSSAMNPMHELGLQLIQLPPSLLRNWLSTVIQKMVINSIAQGMNDEIVRNDFGSCGQCISICIQVERKAYLSLVWVLPSPAAPKLQWLPDAVPPCSERTCIWTARIQWLRLHETWCLGLKCWCWQSHPWPHKQEPFPQLSHKRPISLKNGNSCLRILTLGSWGMPFSASEWLDRSMLLDSQEQWRWRVYLCVNRDETLQTNQNDTWGSSKHGAIGLKESGRLIALSSTDYLPIRNWRHQKTASIPPLCTKRNDDVAF